MVGEEVAIDCFAFEEVPSTEEIIELVGVFVVQCIGERDGEQDDRCE